jgi:hypothetical protein
MRCGAAAPLQKKWRPQAGAVLANGSAMRNDAVSGEQPVGAERTFHSPSCSPHCDCTAGAVGPCGAVGVPLHAEHGEALHSAAMGSAANPLVVSANRQLPFLSFVRRTPRM